MTPLLKVSMFLAQLDPARHSQLIRDLENEAAKSADGKCASYPTESQCARFDLAEGTEVYGSESRAIDSEGVEQYGGQGGV
jgi:hypothetical protein